MVHVKPKCLGEGLGSMRVQSVHVTHVLAEWHFSLCVSVRLPQSVRVHCTHSRRARKKTSQLRPLQSTGKSSPYTWQVLAAMQIKPQSFKDKLSWAFMFVSITAPLLLLAQEVAFSFPLSTLHPASCLFSVIFLCFAAPRQENRHVFTNKSHNISLQWALISWESGCMYAGGELDGRVEKPEGQSGLQGWRAGWPLDTKCRQAFFFLKTSNHCCPTDE